MEKWGVDVSLNKKKVDKFNVVIGNSTRLLEETFASEEEARTVAERQQMRNPENTYTPRKLAG
jgi:hypothetical protein